MRIISVLLTSIERFVYEWLQEHEEDLSEEAQALLSVVDQIFEESFQYRSEYAEQEPRYQLNTWDAGWEQIRRMVYGQDADSEAKKNQRLIELKKDFDTALRTLGDKIAEEYSEDTGF